MQKQQAGAPCTCHGGQHENAAIVIRQLGPDDKERLRAMFDGLSDESRRRRFLSSKNELTECELATLTEIDRDVSEALLALDAETGAPVGVARYRRLERHSLTATIEAAVIDSHQGRGVGGALVDRLTDRALRAGIREFTALMFYDNRAARRALRRAGPPHLIAREVDVVELGIPIRRPRACGGMSPRCNASVDNQRTR